MGVHRAPPYPHQPGANFFHHDGMYASKRPLPLCVYSVTHSSKVRNLGNFLRRLTFAKASTSIYGLYICLKFWPCLQPDLKVWSPGFLSVKFKLTHNGILNSWHLRGEYTEGENNGYVVFELNIHGSAVEKGGEGVTPPALTPSDRRLLGIHMKTTWTVFLHLGYLLHGQNYSSIMALTCAKNFQRRLYKEQIVAWDDFLTIRTDLKYKKLDIFRGFTFLR
jgi:hypothetical protein